MKALHMNKKQSGMTLIEILMVIGIAAVIIVLGMSLFGTTSDRSKIQNEVKNIGVLAAAISSSYANEQDYASLSNAVLHAGNGLPDSMRGAGTAIKNAWDPAGITVGPAAGGAQYQITYDTVPDQACVDLGTATYRSFASLDVNGASIASVGDLATACAAGGNTMVWAGQ